MIEPLRPPRHGWSKQSSCGAPSEPGVRLLEEVRGGRQLPDRAASPTSTSTPTPTIVAEGDAKERDERLDEGVQGGQIRVFGSNLRVDGRLCGHHGLAVIEEALQLLGHRIHRGRGAAERDRLIRVRQALPGTRDEFPYALPLHFLNRRRRDLVPRSRRILRRAFRSVRPSCGSMSRYRGRACPSGGTTSASEPRTNATAGSTSPTRGSMPVSGGTMRPTGRSVHPFIGRARRRDGSASPSALWLQAHLETATSTATPKRRH